jgi:hypothetical protein
MIKGSFLKGCTFVYDSFFVFIISALMYYLFFIIASVCINFNKIYIAFIFLDSQMVRDFARTKLLDDIAFDMFTCF